jgi:hypothetical protein
MNKQRKVMVAHVNKRELLLRNLILVLRQKYDIQILPGSGSYSLETLDGDVDRYANRLTVNSRIQKFLEPINFYSEYMVNSAKLNEGRPLIVAIEPVKNLEYQYHHILTAIIKVLNENGIEL